MSHTPRERAPSGPGEPSSALRWSAPLVDLALRVRRAVREAMSAALDAGRLADVARQVGQGAGDATFGLDVASERAVDRWLEEVAREEPLSLLTEDAGWRHRGPDGAGGVATLAGFEHGGPRVVLDPVDGTRNLMLDLRSAWTVAALAPPGAGTPRSTEVTLGVAAELPDSRAGRYRRLVAARGAGCTLALLRAEDDALLREAPLHADDDDRPDQGYFPFFAFHPDVRPDVAALGADFFARLEREEGARTEHCYDDQYISSGGQLALLALGTYRMVVEARALVAERRGRPTQVCKPYDVAGALLCAQEAGCVVTDLAGGPLDVPLDTDTPVGFAAFANAPTRARLWPHLAAALRSFRPGA